MRSRNGSSIATATCALLCSLAFVLVGCSSEGEEVGQDPTELAANIGAGGGVLTGPAGTIFDGFELSIPAGALAQDTPVRVTAVYDETPLPALAERVGIQFRIEPEVSLAKAATLKLPVAASTVATFEKTAGDVKVWMRKDEAWSLTEQTTSSDGSVTVPLDRFTTAAAGVKLTLQTSSCTSISCTPTPILATCQSTTGFCVEKVIETAPGTGAPTPQSRLATDGLGIYYLAAASSTTSTAIRIDLATKTPKPASPLSGVYYGLNASVDRAGNFWAATGTATGGNMMFNFSGASARFDVGEKAFGAVLLPSGHFVRVTARGRVVVSPTGTVAPLVAWATVAPVHLIAASRVPGSPDVWFDTTGGVAKQSVTTSFGFQRYPIGPNLFYFSISLSSRDSLVAIVGGSQEFIYGNGVTGQMARVPLGFSPLAAVIDDDDGAWVIDATRPQVFYRAADVNGGGLSSAVLAADGSPEAPSLLPRSIVLLPGGSCLVHTSGGKILRVRRAGQF